jgi:hypothetical protein
VITVTASMTATERRRLVPDKTQQILDAVAAMGENKLTFVERVYQLGFALGGQSGGRGHDHEGSVHLFDADPSPGTKPS